MNGNNHPAGLIVGVALQGHTGLRITEAIRLSPNKMDNRNGTIIIDAENRDGVATNDYSVRKIPQLC